MRVQVKKVIESEAKSLNGRSLLQWLLDVQDEAGESHLIGINTQPQNKYEVGQFFDMAIQYRDDGDPKVFPHGIDESGKKIWYKSVKRAQGNHGPSPQRSVATPSGPEPASQTRLSTRNLSSLAKTAQFVTLIMGLNADENTKAKMSMGIFQSFLKIHETLDVFDDEPTNSIQAPNDPRPPEDESVVDNIPF